MAWHGKCYTARAGDKYPIAKLAVMVDDNDDELDDATEMDKYTHARNSDNYMVPFQCDICHFRNITKRDPGLNPVADRTLLIGIRRAVLDSFWSRSASTVANNLGGIKKFWNIGKNQLGLEQLMPEMGPFPLKDLWGMHIAVIILQRSLDKGVYRDTIQFETARKLRSVYSNCWGASINTMRQGVMARETTKTFVTECPTYGMWFERYIKGLHSPMGDDRRPDAAIGSKLMKRLMNKVEVDYLEEDDDGYRRFVARAGLFYLGSFFGSLRGEEVNRILRKNFILLNEDAMKLPSNPHVVLPLFGNFKGEQGVPRCYLRRVVIQSKSGLEIGTWVRRVISFEMTSKTKYLFASMDGSKQKAGVYEEYLFRKLEEIQIEEEGLIPRVLKVREAYGISRSFRRGSTTEATNADNRECNSTDIERNN